MLIYLMKVIRYKQGEVATFRKRKVVPMMSTYETLSLMIMFSMLIIAVLKFRKK